MIPVLVTRDPHDGDDRARPPHPDPRLRRAGSEDEKQVAYQGFNEGTVYPQKRGENYIYEGLILRFLKSQWQYQDATNVVGYYTTPLTRGRLDVPDELRALDPAYFSRQDHHRSWHGAGAGRVRRGSAQEPVGVPLLRLERSEAQGLRPKRCSA